ncbi:MAG: hypothetical protein HKN47_12730 [Pirellulaceae bacterium]|nr:hypothetical protein [Pirellulaceae bacterium]
MKTLALTSALVISLVGLWTLPLSIAANGIFEVTPNPATLDQLTFRVVNDDAHAIESVVCKYSIYSQGQTDPLRGELKTKLVDDVFRIPITEPVYGRIRIWIDADDGKDRSWSGYDDFSYHLRDVSDPAPALIELNHGIVVRGQVISQRDGEPIAGAEVAPMRLGHHFAYPLWDRAGRTDSGGRFRIATDGADGVEARHSEFANNKTEFWRGNGKPPADLQIVLSPKRQARGRVVDERGEPISGVDVGDSTTDKEGRFTISMSMDQWRSPKSITTFYAPGYQYHTMSTRSLSLGNDRETTITLQRMPRVSGMVVDQDGQPIADAKIQIQEKREYVQDVFVDVPTVNGRWEAFVDENCQEFVLRISTGETVQYSKTHRNDEIAGPIEVSIPVGHRIEGRFAAPVQQEHAPTILLRDAQERIIRQAAANDDGRFTLAGVEDGTYTLQLYPARYEIYCSGTYGSDPLFEQNTKGFWEQKITISGADVDVSAIDLAKENLLPGRIEGVAVDPRNPNVALANGFIYLVDDLERWDTVGNSYYMDRVMTDSSGKFAIPVCPPGQYYLVTSDSPTSHDSENDGYVLVMSGSTTQVTLRRKPEKQQRDFR